MLVITRKVNESIFVLDENENIEVVVLELSKDKVKLGVKAPRNVKIMRSELVAVKTTNVEASKAAPLSKEALDALMKFKK
jgi:carbon storage regulator